MYPCEYGPLSHLNVISNNRLGKTVMFAFIHCDVLD